MTPSPGCRPPAPSAGNRGSGTTSRSPARTPPVPLPDLEHHLHRALAQLLGYFRCAAMALHPPRNQSLQDSRGGPTCPWPGTSGSGRRPPDSPKSPIRPRHTSPPCSSCSSPRRIVSSRSSWARDGPRWGRGASTGSSGGSSCSRARRHSGRRCRASPAFAASDRSALCSASRGSRRSNRRSSSARPGRSSPRPRRRTGGAPQGRSRRP